MTMFQIDFKKLVLLLLPTFLRRERIVAFLNVLTAPVASLFNLFDANREGNLYRLRTNGQVCYLRRALNDAFPDAGGQIRIEDIRSGNWVMALDESLTDDQLIVGAAQPVIIWDADTIMKETDSFLVVVPAGVNNPNNDAKLRSILNLYKLTSKSYQIIYE